MTPSQGVTPMDGHNLKDKALNELQHSEIPPTTERLHNAWNRGSYPGQGSFLLSEDAGRRLVRSQEQLSGAGSDVAAAEGYLRGDRYTPGQGSNERSELEGLDLDESVEKLGPWAAVGYAVAIALSVFFWIALIGWVVTR